MSSSAGCAPDRMAAEVLGDVRGVVVAGRRELRSPDMSRRHVVEDELEHGRPAMVVGWGSLWMDLDREDISG